MLKFEQTRYLSTINSIYLVLAIITSMVLATALPVQAIEARAKSKVYITTTVGYTLGMGEDFDDVNLSTFKSEAKAGFNADLSFHIRLSETFYLGPELFIQQYSTKYENFGFVGTASNDKTFTNFFFLLSMAKRISSDSTTSTFFTSGLGVYDHDSMGPGAYIGIDFVSGKNPNSKLVVSARYHLAATLWKGYSLLSVSIGKRFGL